MRILPNFSFTHIIAGIIAIIALFAIASLPVFDAHAEGVRSGIGQVATDYASTSDGKLGQVHEFNTTSTKELLENADRFARN